MVHSAGAKHVEGVLFFHTGEVKVFVLISSLIPVLCFILHFSLDALDPNAYAAFQASNDLADVVQRCLKKKQTKPVGALPGMSKKLSIRATLMTPVKPMLVGIGSALNIMISIPVLVLMKNEVRGGQAMGLIIVNCYYTVCTPTSVAEAGMWQSLWRIMTQLFLSFLWYPWLPKLYRSPGFSLSFQVGRGFFTEDRGWFKESILWEW